MTARMPKYRLHKPSGQAVATLGGRDYYLGRHGTEASRGEYDRLVAEWLANGRPFLRAASGGGPVDLTINELMLAYLDWADGYYVKNGKPTSEPVNIRLALRALRKLYGHTMARDFGPLALKTVRQTIVDSGLCRREVNKRTRHITRAFRWAVENELVPPSVHHGLKAVSGLKKGRTDARESAPVKPVPDAFVDAIASFVAPQIWAMVQLQSLTGMRPGEVTIMRTCDLDTSGRVWIYTPESHKTEHHGKERRVYLGPNAQAILRPWLRADLTGYLFSPRDVLEDHLAERRKNRNTPMTPSQRARQRVRKRQRPPGEHYTSGSYLRVIKVACGKAGVPPWHPNQLRHNAATRIRREFGLDVARVVLGHSSPVVTEVYAELDGAKAAKAMERVG
jgi:integrase